ncbi:hypothetical protein [Saccharothrix yanglingensis]|uniref:Uncharacterized protein n=1 Tax=Saccharothrix yanglingensis TaxID=659496 RepID=A0ABU0WXS7_9PSEU|nr:hypothetical protein [Saccharothrix yanglingensis]MDQ2584653.1 hypothetical protein [Saccharothrix yanglingensis]
MSYAMIKGGTDVRAWARIRDDTAIEWEAGPDEVGFTIGGRHGLELLVTAAGLRNLVATGSAALAALETFPNATAPDPPA